MNLVLAVSTYNRMGYLLKLLDSFTEYRNPAHNWRVIVVDDGSTDGTRAWLTDDAPSMVNGLEHVFTWRKGVHHSKNQALRMIRDTEFDVAFMVDDDIYFKRHGWEDHYLAAMKESKVDHLIHYCTAYRPDMTHHETRKGKLVARCNAHFVQGAFFTVTPAIIKHVGFMDCINYGLAFGGHVDYSVRCMRAGFSCEDTPWDADGSEEFIGMHTGELYHPAITKHERDEREAQSAKLDHKRRLLRDPLRCYIPYNETSESWDKPETNDRKVKVEEQKQEPVKIADPEPPKPKPLPLRVHIGCGSNVKAGWDNLDQFVKQEGVINCDCRKLPYADRAADEVLAEDVLEHFGRNEWRAVLREWVRVLKPGGKMTIRVPDMKKLAENLLCSNEDVVEWEKFNRRVFGDQGGEGMTHYTGFAHPCFAKILSHEFGMIVEDQEQLNCNLKYVLRKS